jgi:Inner membrane component of T3SS, cytoplasmic domain/Inner membrane component of T3SS, periplasmic domain
MSVSTVRRPAEMVGGRKTRMPRGIVLWPDKNARPAARITSRLSPRLTCTITFLSLQRLVALTARRARREIAVVAVFAIEAAAKTLRVIDASAGDVGRRGRAHLLGAGRVPIVSRPAAVVSSAFAGMRALRNGRGTAGWRFAGFPTQSVARRGGLRSRHGFVSAWARTMPGGEGWIVPGPWGGVRGTARRLLHSWWRTIPALVSRAAAATAGLQRSVVRVRRGLVGFQERTILAAKTQVSVVTATLSCGSSNARGGVAQAYRRSAAESRSFVSAVTRALQRAGKRGRTGVTAGWDGTVKTVEALTLIAIARVRRGGGRARAGIGASWRGGVWVVRSAVSAVRARLRRGVRASRAGLAVGWDAAVAAISSAISFMLAGLRGLVRWARAKLAAAMQPRTPPLEGVVFEVVGGLHDGVRVMLESGTYRIGCTAEADIVLRDPGVMPGHAVLGVQRGNIRLEAIGEDVGVGTRTVMKGHGCRLRLPLQLSIGEASLRLSHVETRSAGRSRLAIAGIAVVSVCAVALIALGFLREEGMAGVGPTPAPVAPTRVASSDPAAGLPAPEHDEREQIADAAMLERIRQELTAHIKDAKIRTIRVAVADGGVAVSGILGARDRTSWSDVQFWFDQTYRGHVALTTNFTESKPPNLQLRAVWFGEHPYVITAQGQHFNKGAILDDGWTIQEIGEDHLMLAKDGDTQPFSYR